MAGKDPYRYFRVEARELADGLALGVLALERGAGAEEVARLLRLAHTLKGAARVVKQPGIAELAHAFEELLTPHRGSTAGVEKSQIAPLLALVDGITQALARLDPPAAPPIAASAAAAVQASPTQASPTQASPAVAQANPAGAQAGAAIAQTQARRGPELPPLETVRVELSEMDALLRGVAETGVRLSALRRLVEQLEAAQAGRLASALEQVERELLQVRDTADRLRLLPASTLFGSLERAVRDAAELTGKQASFRASAGDNRLDAHVLARLGEALLHVVRNAVAHGLELPGERAASGKSAPGLVELLVERRGRRLVFTCRDDGRGLDLKSISAQAARRGQLADPSRTLGVDEAVGLLLQGGLSTTQVADATSGRGVGLDVVRAVMAELRGEVSVKSEPGQGTRVELAVPISLAAVSALQAVAGGQLVSIPLSAVPRVLRLGDGEIALSSERASIDYEGRAIPFLQLWRALRRDDPNAPDRAGSGSARSAAKKLHSVLIVRSEDSHTAVLVDQLLGAAELVARPLPAMPADPLVGGASFDADGNPCLLLDPAGIALAARSAAPAPREETAQRPPILVIDDSLTTRMLEQSILESAGYLVETATSAEEGLEKARARRFGLFLVDVEMPGISGFEFVARTQADPLLRETPAILVTSRNSDDDKRRGKDAGARAYIVKGEFDQRHLLQSIRRLMG